MSDLAAPHSEPIPEPHLLLAEDDPMVRNALRRSLARHINGFTIDEAVNGEEGLSIAERQKSNLVAIATDRQMPPGMGGIEMIQRILSQRGDARRKLLTTVISGGAWTPAESAALIRFLQIRAVQVVPHKPLDPNFYSSFGAVAQAAKIDDRIVTPLGDDIVDGSGYLVRPATDDEKKRLFPNAQVEMRTPAELAILAADILDIIHPEERRFIEREFLPDLQRPVANLRMMTRENLGSLLG